MAQTEHLSGNNLSASPGAMVFSAAILAATILPIVLIKLATQPGLLALSVNFLLAVASAHVFTTFYLLVDRTNARFILDHPVQLIAMPIALFLVGLTVFSMPGNPFFVPMLFILFLQQTWHFGAQNIGVAMFISLAHRKTSITKIEKNFIRMGTICGMFGVLSALYPSFMIGPENVPIDETVLASIWTLHTIGGYIAIVLTGGALALMAQAWWKREYFHGAAIFLSITFLFPMYISDNYMIAVASFTIAHGLQYIIFLAAHSFTNPGTPKNPKWRPWAFIYPPLALLALGGAGHLLWTAAPTWKSGQFPLFGLAIILGLTLAHFWVDQFMWRMGNPDRATWIKQSYRFIFQPK
ncbi:MAG: hypothetical protein ACKVJQ_11710 [Alphaproteobacteria bacterium]|jgi:hypothetical protein